MTENKGRAGRKPVDLRTLIFWEWHWWQAFSLIRDGVIGGQEIDGGLFPVADWKDPVRPAWMTHPGAIHEWEKKVREDYYSRFEQKSYYSKGVPVERHLWEALKRARTARQVRRICSQSRWRSRLSNLYEHAEEFLHALKKDAPAFIDGPVVHATPEAAKQISALSGRSR